MCSGLLVGSRRTWLGPAQAAPRCGPPCRESRPEVRPILCASRRGGAPIGSVSHSKRLVQKRAEAFTEFVHGPFAEGVRAVVKKSAAVPDAAQHRRRADGGGDEPRIIVNGYKRQG